MPQHATAGPGASPLLTIGSWPGREEGHNRFIRILLDALEAEGARIVSVPDSRAIRLDDLDVLLIHWPERIFAEARHAGAAALLMAGFLGRLRARPRRARVVWIVHNLRPHAARGFKRLSWPVYSGGLSRLVDGALTLAAGTRAPVRAAYPALARRPLDHFWHPSYPEEDLPVGIGRAGLGWAGASTVYGYCGQLHRNKGVENLVTAFRGLTDPAARLLVAGRPFDGEIAGALRGLAGDDPRIHLRLRDLAEDDFRASLATCDIVVAPFRRYLHSGSLVHALSMGRPVLTPSTPFADSLADHLASPGWIQTYDGPLDPAVLAAATIPGTPLDLDRIAPAAAARQVLGFIERLAGSPAPVSARPDPEAGGDGRDDRHDLPWKAAVPARAGKA
jgi:beta-1,4-mannosyltransferase